MNDPHVESLIYKIQHPEDVDYEQARQLTHSEAEFKIELKNGQAEVRLLTHCSTIEDARALVSPFLEVWELSAALEYGAQEFQFVYDRANVVDRNPTPGVVSVEGTILAISGGHAKVHIGRSAYPDPPVGIARDPLVDLLFKRFCLYREGKTTLPDAANYCLTALERSTGSRRDAARVFNVTLRVLSKFGELAAKKGGMEARKFDGSSVEFSTAERAWLDTCMVRLIMRAAETAYDPGLVRQQISMNDLPPL